MMIRAQVRRVPARKKKSNVTGLIYLFGYNLSGKSVVVMDVEMYSTLRRRLTLSTKRLSQIKKMCGNIKKT